MSNEEKDMAWVEDESNSLLTTNSSKMQEEQPVRERKPMSKKTAKAVIAAALTVLGIILVFVAGAVISELNYQAELAEAAKRELRSGEKYHSIDAPELVEDELAVGVTQLYYSAENGMSVMLTFVNGQDTQVTLDTVELVLENSEGERIASAGETKVKNWVVAAGETASFELYLKPNVVEITDDPLEEIVYTIDTTEAIEE